MVEIERSTLHAHPATPVVLAIDGGGTKTECLVAGSGGQVIGYGRGGPVNLGFVDPAIAEHSIHQALTAALPVGGIHLDVVVLGATVAEEFVRSILDRLASYSTFLNVGESLACLASGTADECGAVVLAGTGAFQWARNRHGDTHRTDGLGALIGDEGSAYDLVRRALVACGRAWDGRGAQTLLTEQFCQQFGVDGLRAVGRHIYQSRMPRHEIAALAPLVSSVADDDPVARVVLRETGNLLADGLETCIARVGLDEDRFSVVLCGGVFNAGQPIIEPIAARLATVAPGAAIVRPAWPPVVGVLALSLQAAGLQLDQAGVRALGEQYQSVVSSGGAHSWRTI